ncbi:phage distal tail protein [Nonomuraea indica]|uniref:phage distal tail protein n=1 Tax=Nonomuraea indica TaxID=1581193 RepID=UPI000C7B2710|nr:phage tail domain-containing protein [Nonomuraea indica]
MAIAIHGSSPALISQADASVTTAAFSPPADSVLVAMVLAYSGSAQPAVSGGGLTWTRRVRQNSTGSATYAEIWTAPCPAGATNITVTATGNDVNFPSTALKVDVVTGASLAAPAGNSGTGTSTTNVINPTGYTSSQAGSRGFIAATSGDGAAPSSTDDEVAFVDSNGHAGLMARKAANTASAGTAVTFNLDASGTGSADWRWAALEIRPGSVDASADMPSVSVPATPTPPSVRIDADVTTATVAVAASPLPLGASAGAGAGAGLPSIAVPAAVQTLSVTTENAEIVNVGPLVVPATPLQLDASAGASVNLPAAAVPVTVPQLDVRSDATVMLPFVSVGVQVPLPRVTVPVLPGDAMDGAAGQIEFNGTVLGRTTPYRWINLAGWRDKPSIDSGNVPRASRHGSWRGRPLLQERIVLWTAQLRTSRDEVEAAVNALEQALPVEEDETERPLVINDLGTPYLIYGRIDKHTLDQSKRLRLGLAPLVLQWVCSDPRRYNINSTGVTIPVGDEAEISNAGNTATHPILRVHGPATTPVVVNETMSRQVGFAVTLLAGEQLVIDCDRGTATVDGEDVMSTLTGASVHPSDFVLGRGTNLVSHSTTAGGAEVDVLYRDAWA